MASKIKVVQKEQIEAELRKVIQEAYDKSPETETFYVGLSGGSLPPMLVRVLKQLEKVNWKRWLFFFCDERCVPTSSPDSTFGTYKRLLEPIDERLPLSLSQFVTIDPALKGDRVAGDYVSKMRTRFPNLPIFDLLFLGLGPDGHTCSLFPGHRLLKETSKWVAYISDSPKPPPERITMTLPILNNAKLCLFVAAGVEKAQVIKEILDDKKPYPAGMVQGNVLWLLDEAAGSLLKSST